MIFSLDNKLVFIDNKLVFIDSLQSLGSSLDSLVRNLRENYFKHLSREFDSEVLDLVKQKGFSPYEYMCDLEKLNENLPDKNQFYSSLRGKGISDKEYQHVLKVWNKFEKNMRKDYHDLCLIGNVLLLADIIENFRNRYLENYSLSPRWWSCFYISKRYSEANNKYLTSYYPK